MVSLPVLQEPRLLAPTPLEVQPGGATVRGGARPWPASRFARQQLGFLLLSVGTDVASLLTAMALFSMLWPSTAAVDSRLGAIGVVVVIWIGALWASGCYHRRSAPPWIEAGKLLCAAAVALFMHRLLIPTPAAPPFHEALYVGFLTFALAVVTRGALRRLVRRAQREGWFCRRALIVGSDGQAVATLPAQLRTVGLAPVGFVAAGDIGMLGEAIRTHDVSCVVASPILDTSSRLEVVRAARRHGAEATVAGGDGTISPLGPPVDAVGMDVALAITPHRSHRSQMRRKRLFDVAAATGTLLLLSPFLGIVALAVLVTSGRPILFRQTRITRGGRPFTIYKFRTMVVDADRRCSQNGSEMLFFKNSDRTLLTPIGAILRRFSIDELPQLWNVLRGDMSVVGPRPLPAEQVAANTEFLDRRHEIPTGLTGWWQVNGRSEVDADHALDMDLFYVDNWSFVFDIYILFKTARAVVSRTGAY